MSEINATSNYGDAKQLAAKGAVRAIVRGRVAIVFAQTWDPVTANSDMPPYSITARVVRADVQDIEAQGTPEADSGTQQLINRLMWDEWLS